MQYKIQYINYAPYSFKYIEMNKPDVNSFQYFFLRCAYLTCYARVMRTLQQSSNTEFQQLFLLSSDCNFQMSNILRTQDVTCSWTYFSISMKKLLSLLFKTKCNSKKGFKKFPIFTVAWSSSTLQHSQHHFYLEGMSHERGN